MKDNERQEIEKFGQLQENGIFTMTIIGEIEGHQLSAQNAKTTKYEHMIPTLAKVLRGFCLRFCHYISDEHFVGFAQFSS